MYKQVFEKIEELKDEYLQFWIDICNIESPTNDKKGVDEVGTYLINKAKELGFDIEIHEEEVSGNALCITMNKESKNKPIAISGHMDTVHPKGLFSYPPVTVKDGIIYGPGVTDCKGGLAACFLAMRALHDCDFKDRPVKFIVQSDEEVSSRFSNKATINWMGEKAKDCVGFLNTEMSIKNTIVVQRKGISRYRFNITGKAAHASACYTGISSIKEAAFKIIELEKLQDKDGITVSVGTINGGSAINSVPYKCQFEIDVRFKDDKQMNEADEYVRKIGETCYIEGSGCEVELISRRVAMSPNKKNEELADKMNEVYAKCGLPILEKRATNGGSDSADIASYGIPAIDSIGVSGGNVHAREEYGEIASLTKSAKALAAAIIGVY